MKDNQTLIGKDKLETHVLQSNLESAENIKGVLHFRGRASTFAIIAETILALRWTQEQSCFLSSVILAVSTNALYVMQHSLVGSFEPLRTNGALSKQQTNS